MGRFHQFALSYPSYTENTVSGAINASVGLFLLLAFLNLALFVVLLAYALFSAFQGSALGPLLLVPILLLAFSFPLPAARLTNLLHHSR
jgi:hypothetical protein